MKVIVKLWMKMEYVKNVKKDINFNKFQVIVIKIDQYALKKLLFLFVKNIIPMEVV